MKNRMSLSLFVIFLTILTLAFCWNGYAKSLYVIADINQSPSPIQAYDIQGTNLVYQATYNVPHHGYGAVGLAIDADAAILFVTYENSNIIQLVDAVTMTGISSTSAPAANNLAGIVVDHDKNRVYTMNRKTNHLYVYDWDPNTYTLTLVGGTYTVLPGVYQAYGIALDEDNDILYVGDNSTVVKAFYTSDWSAAGQYTISHNATGIAIDYINQIFYTGSGAPYSSNYNLSKYDLNTNTETTVNVGSPVLGVAVDQATGLVYCTTYGYGSFGTRDRLFVYDSNLTQHWVSGDLGNPTGLTVPGREVGFNPLNLTKDDGIPQGSCVNAGSGFTYTITYDNAANNFDVHGVVIIDQLPPEVDFVSLTGPGSYDSGTHTATWTIGTLAAGSAGGTVTIDVLVKPSTPAGQITNVCRIESNETGPTTVNVLTDVCVPSGDVTPPTCTLVNYNPGPPLSITGAVQDNESGLAAINVVQANNVTVNIASFTPGTNDPVLVTATKIDNNQSGYVLIEAIDMDGNSTLCDPVYTTLSTIAPESYELTQNFPNPFNPTTTIHFKVAPTTSGLANVSIRIYDLSGREVKTLINEPMEPGEYAVEWDGTNARGKAVAGGVYIYRMVAGEFAATKKMILLK